jgi:hypothetical protein
VAERDVVHVGGPAQLVRLTPDGEPPSDLGVREELLLRVESGGFRNARHEGVDASLGACREVAAAARELMRAAQGGDEGEGPGADAAPAFEGDSFARVSRALLAGFGDHVGWRFDNTQQRRVAGIRAANQTQRTLGQHAALLATTHRRQSAGQRQ